MIVSGRVCENRGSNRASRSSKEAERAASLDFILDVSAVIFMSTGDWKLQRQRARSINNSQ